MSRWIQRVDSHAVRATLPSIASLLSPAGERSAQSPEDLELFDRVRRTIEYIEHAIAASDPLLIPPAALNNLQAPLNSLQAELSNYISNGNNAHLVNCNSYCDTALQYVGDLPRPLTPSDVEEVERAIAALRRSVSDFSNQLQVQQTTQVTQLADLRTKTTELSNEITAQKARLDDAIARFQQQFSDAEQARRTDATAREQERSDKFTAATAEQKTRFETQLTDWQTAFTSLLETAANDQKQSLNVAKIDVEKRLQDLSAQGEAFLSQMKDQKRRAEELLSAITNTGNVAGFQRVANEERAAAGVWHRVTVGSMVGFILFAVFAFEQMLTSHLDWGVFSARVIVLIAFGILAGYGARQADKHETAERWNRKLELELASIHPFLAGLPEQMQHEIKRNLAERMFGNSAPEEKQTQTQVTGSALDVAKLAVTALSELTKK